MKRVAVFFSNGTEEIEGITPVDVLRRSGAVCDIVSVCGELVTGSHEIVIKADKVLEKFNLYDYDAIVLPGGLQGAISFSENQAIINIVKVALETGKLVASICASPALVLAKHNLIKGKKATCYPSDDFIKLFNNCFYTGKEVEVDENLVTANGPKSSMEFSIAICNKLGLEPKI